jgi:phosphoribosyl-ATP pyrophosphohydrolase/phosphoribosyl-AMP cyclohydrolase
MEWSTLKVNERGLLPVVVQDFVTQQVIMVAYTDESGFDETLETGEMVYYSRSRQERWKKGETSGHIQKVKGLFLDCDQDTLLAQVEQVGVGCHKGSFSCFDGGALLGVKSYKQKEFSVLENLEAIIRKRKEDKTEGSYTNYLFEKGIDKMLKKIGEEAAEVIIAAKNNDREEVIYETSDLMYHLMVTLNQCGVSWWEIEASLKGRFPE